MATTRSKWLALLGSAFIGMASAAFAQDSGPLLDLLVKKGVINDQEAENLRAELTKDFAANSSAGKLNVGSHITEFKLSGDFRFRHQIETQAPETATGSNLVTNERTRERLRFRFNGDVLMQKGWGGGFSLETAQAADSGNQTIENGNDDYNIYLARAYLSYQYSRNLGFVMGRQRNPFYTTDLIWDSDINPGGLTELYTIPFAGKNTLEFRASQTVMDDSPESDNTLSARARRDAWMFYQQAVYTHWFGSDALGNKVNSLIFAPGYMTYNDSTLTGLTNENPANTSTDGLSILVFAGEANWKNLIGQGSTFKLYWDSGYNLEAGTRVREVYGLTNPAIDEDPLAWLIGVGYGKGTGKLQGDYAFKLDYRVIGLGAVDPNINDSDFAFGKLNQKGFKASAVYNVTDFASLSATYFNTTDIQQKLTYALANLDHSQTLQIDLVVKF
jgi:polyhydroxyalkanoate synthesis regulator phasin